MGCFPHLSPSPWAADSVPLPQPRARQSSCGQWGSGPIRPSPPELESVEGAREPPDQPRTHTRGCVRRQGSAGLEPEAACGFLLLMLAGQRPQFRFCRGNGVHPQGGRVASQKRAYNTQPEPLRVTDN